ncbi:hypothetical protein GCM10010331_76040 [Streptomyces xanthochromogenes]|nr:hypothetical protein GCM10010331_76040 [Streptomyces xanthochromogenes]
MRPGNDRAGLRTANRPPEAPLVGSRACGSPRRLAYRKELISIVSVRPGPTPIAEIGAPDISSRAFT